MRGGVGDASPGRDRAGGSARGTPDLDITRPEPRQRVRDRRRRSAGRDLRAHDRGDLQRSHRDEEEQYRIIRHINDLIDHSPPGSVIRIASMTLNQRSTIDALLAAYARGVDVRIILPAAMRAKPGPVSVTAVLGSNKSASSYIFFCTNSCYRSGATGVHH